MTFRMALVGLTIVAAQAPRPSLDYTQWRGRDRDGSASGFVEPATWPSALLRAWKTDVGEGYGTPLVVGEMVYVFTRMDGREVLTALNASSGEVAWRSGYDAPYDPAPPAAKHGAGPKATPLYAQGRIITLGVGGSVAAFDAAGGALLWKIPVAGEQAYFGAGSSPLADGTLVIVHPGNYGPLTALDAATGAVVWTAGDEGFFASPILATIDGTRQVITLTQKAVIGVSVPDGRVLWQSSLPNNGGITPVIDGQTVIVSALDAGVAALRPRRAGTSWTVEKAWETKAVSMYVSNPVLVNGTLFGLSHRNSGQLFAIDAANGATRWLGTARWADNAALVKAGGMLFILKDDGTLVVARPDASRFEPVATYAVADGATWAQPAISGDRIFVKGTSSVALWRVAAQPAQESVHFLPAGRVATRNMREVPAVDLAPGVHVRTVVGAQASFSLGEFEPRAAAVLHHHTREQADIAIDGAFEMTIANHVEALGPGAGVIVPPNVSHSIRNPAPHPLSVIEFHTVPRPDLVPPRPALTFPASADPVDTPGGRDIVVPLQEPANANADKRASIEGETCTMAWRIILMTGPGSNLNPAPARAERFFYVVQGDATLINGAQTEHAPAGTLIVVPAEFGQDVQLKASGAAGDVYVAEFSLTRK